MTLSPDIMAAPHLRIIFKNNKRWLNLDGRDYADLAAQFVNEAGADNRYVGWDVPLSGGRGEILARKIAAAPFAGFAWLNHRPLAAAWLDEASPACAALHFMICQNKKRDQVHEAGRVFTDEAMKRYKSLYCLIPDKFYGASILAGECGLKYQFTLKGGCNVRSMNKIMDGRVYVRQY